MADRKRSFTLIEMLVVMAILATLLGLILAGVHAARAKGRRIACANNLKQIGQTLDVYMNNSDGYFPGHPAYDQYNNTTNPEYPYINGTDSLTPYLGDVAVSRFLVLGVGARLTGTSGLSEGNLNWMATGLGILIKRGFIEDANVLLCPSMKGECHTVYSGHSYPISSAIWKTLRKSWGDCVERGDGTKLATATVAGSDPRYTTAILGNYAYRCQPYYVPGGTAGTMYTVDFIRPKHRVQWMTPFFKTRGDLGDRALLSDTFDFGEVGGSGDSFAHNQGLQRFHHRRGYNVLYGDSHLEYYADDGEIANWNVGADDDYNLTISGGKQDGSGNHLCSQGQAVWHLFDLHADIDR